MMKRMMVVRMEMKQSHRMRIVKENWLSILLVGVLVLIVGVGLLVKIGVERAAAEEVAAKFPDRGVPRMNIALNGVTLQEINAGSKEVKYEGNELSLYEGSEVREFGGVQVKGRGNSTWGQEKKPYQIKFDKRVDLFGLGKARKWCLLANYYDDSNLRNQVAVDLEKILQMDYSVDGRFVELYVDGEYLGLYYITGAIEIEKNRVDLKDEMGILIELDNIHWGNKVRYLTNNGDTLTLKDLVNSNNGEVALAKFLEKYNMLEVAIANRDYERVESLIDVDSWAKYYLLSEFSNNPDAYLSSFYMNMDGLDDVIHAGPGWDYDYAFGNQKWANWMGEKFYSPTEKMIRKQEIDYRDDCPELIFGENCDMGADLSRVMFDLMGFDEFVEVVKKVFQERMAGRNMELLSDVLKKAELIRKAASINNERWKMMDYELGLNDLLAWIQARYDYFENEYGRK